MSHVLTRAFAGTLDALFRQSAFSDVVHGSYIPVARQHGLDKICLDMTSVFFSSSLPSLPYRCVASLPTATSRWQVGDEAHRHRAAQGGALPSELMPPEGRRAQRLAIPGHLQQTPMYLPLFVRCSPRLASIPVAK